MAGLADRAFQIARHQGFGYIAGDLQYSDVAEQSVLQRVRPDGLSEGIV